MFRLLLFFHRVFYNEFGQDISLANYWNGTYFDEGAIKLAGWVLVSVC